MTALMIQAVWETVLMVGIASVIGIVLGVPLAVVLHGTARGGLFESRWVNWVLGFVVNAVRSTPYIILVISLIPVTRWVVGSSIGTLAASVSLSLAAVMVYCRLVEEAMRGVPGGLVEAAEAMGASRWQVFSKVLIPEALPAMVSGLTLVIISLIGFSAMAGIVGGGGLGDLANRYGYQRYDMGVMVAVVVILVVMVQGVQVVGDWWVRRLRK